MKYFCVTDGYILVIFSFFVLNNSCIAFNWHGFGELSRLFFITIRISVTSDCLVDWLGQSDMVYQCWPHSLKLWWWQLTTWHLFTPRQRKGQLISECIKGPVVTAFRSPLVKVLDSSVKILGLWIVTSWLHSLNF